VVSSMHVHLNHDLCLEVIVLRGPAPALQELAAELSGLKGIHQAQLVIARAVAEKEATPTHPHSHPHPHPHRH
jgi:CopG family transcriptional regulator, nickel-responsive regulator